MRRAAILFAALAAAAPAAAESPAPPPLFSYADVADLALASPVAAHVRVAEATLLKGDRAAAVPAGRARYYVQADVVSLIRANQSLPARIAYLADLPRDARGKAPKLRKGTEFILLASAVPGRPGEVRLVAPDAQLPFSTAEGARVRAILREATGPAAPPQITGFGRAFHVPGAVPGESETQIFLQTADGRPVSLNVLRRPGETPQWAVALSEIVDDSAAPPVRDTLLWYRLACGLPRAMPRQSLAEAEPGSATAIEADYRVVLNGLGPCVRRRGRA